MADETFEIGLKITGENKAARAFENLKLRQMEASAEATKLAAELRKLQQSGTASAEQIEAASRALIRAKQSASDYGRQATQVSRAMAAQKQTADGAASAISSMGQRVSKTAGAVGNLGSVVSAASPELGRMGGIVGALGTAITGASGAMGPWGIAIAGITGAVSIGVAALESYRGEVRSLAEEADIARAALEGMRAVAERSGERQGTLSGLVSREQFTGQRQTTETEIAILEEEITRRHAVIRREAARTEAAIRREANRTANELSALSVTNPFASDEARDARMGVADAEREIERVGLRTLEVQLEQLRNDREMLAQANARNLAYNEQNKTLENQFSIFQRLGPADDLMTQAAALRAATQADRDRQRTEAERRRQAAQQAAQQAYRAMMAERERLDQASEDQANAFHQNALSRIAELTEELERTGDILDPTARAAADARIALEGTFSGLAREDAEKARASASQRADARRGIARTGGDMGADLAEFRAFVAAQGDMDAERTQRYQDALHAREDAHRAHILALRDLEASGTDWTAEQFNRRLALHQEMIAQQRADEAAAVERTKELAAITDGMWESIGGSVTDAAGSMFKFLISGAEGGSDAFLAMLDSFLEATAVEYTIKALGEAANAVAAAARQDYAAAAQHGVAAGMAAAVAAATGLASAAISVPSTGAGAGAPPQVGAGAQSGATTNITIQLYAPQAVFTEAERGELIARGVREAERVRPGSARF